MIPDAILHLLNDQPLLVDLVDRPGPADTVLLCTNVRTLSGTRPHWIADSRSLFGFPFSVIRFVEIRSDEAIAERDEAGQTVPAAGAGPEPDADLEIDEDLLRRVREVRRQPRDTGE